MTFTAVGYLLGLRADANLGEKPLVVGPFPLGPKNMSGIISLVGAFPRFPSTNTMFLVYIQVYRGDIGVSTVPIGILGT